MELEGGYVDHTVAGDTGGRTYAGIASKFHPEWKGWELLNNDDYEGARKEVRGFYHQNYWNPLYEDLQSVKIAFLLYDYSVNAGIKNGSKERQKIIDVGIDGIFGKQTLAGVNNHDESLFILSYSLRRVARYAGICNRNKVQKKFLLGWINRTLKAVDTL